VFLPKRPPRPVSADLSWRLVRQNGRPADVVAFEESVVEFFLEAAEALAVPKSLAAIYGVCFASPVPLSFSEVRDRLGISSGSVSQGLRILQNVNALKVITSPLTKRERFEPDLELRKLIAHYLEERVEKQLNSGRDRLQAIARAIPNGSDGSGKILRARLKSLQSWHDKSRRFYPRLLGSVAAGNQSHHEPDDPENEADNLAPRAHPSHRPGKKYHVQPDDPKEQ
jgi:DNA-binding transcriptional regulator GbsR (MarR family)